MECEFIKGFREGSNLLYVPSEKYLYRFKSKRNGIQEFICYQTIIDRTKKINPASNEDQLDCTARVRLLSNVLCERRFEHVCHQNHEQIVREMNKTNNMKDVCQFIKQNLTEDAHRNPTKHIFQREIAKCVFFRLYP